MPGLSPAEIDRLLQIVTDVYPSDDLGKPGSWGILPLCCAAQGAHSQSWRATMIEIIQSDDLVVASIMGEYPDHFVAWRFSEFLKEQLSFGLGLARTRIESFRLEKGLPLSGRSYDGHLHWTTLAIALDSLDGLQTDDFQLVRNWAESHANGWLVLFFGAGLHLSDEPDFPWPGIAGFLASLDPRLKEVLATYRAQARSERGGHPRQESADVPEHLHSLDRERIVLDQIAQLGVPLFAVTGEAPLVISGECYAYEFSRMSANQDQPWHWTLMRASLVALAALRAKKPVLAAYELRGGLVRLFLCANDLRMTPITHVGLAAVPGYIECGHDSLSVAHMRPVAYRTPAVSLVALWPLPIDARRPGPYAIDAGNLLQFRSYPEADHSQGLALDLAGPDYLRVPTRAEGRLDPEGILYLNHWADCVYPDPARFR